MLMYVAVCSVDLSGRYTAGYYKEAFWVVQCSLTTDAVWLVQCYFGIGIYLLIVAFAACNSYSSFEKIAACNMGWLKLIELESQNKILVWFTNLGQPSHRSESKILATTVLQWKPPSSGNLETRSCTVGFVMSGPDQSSNSSMLFAMRRPLPGCPFYKNLLILSTYAETSFWHY
jgi:hypothetical protein